MSLRNLLLLISLTGLIIACNSKDTDTPSDDDQVGIDSLAHSDSLSIDTLATDTVTADSNDTEVVEEIEDNAPQTPVVENPTSPITSPNTMSKHESPEQAKIDSIKAAKTKLKK